MIFTVLNEKEIHFYLWPPLSNLIMVLAKTQELGVHRPWWANQRREPLCGLHPATGSGHFKPFFRLSLTSDLRLSTMLFITHLIVNERKCNQQLLCTLYMESRRLLSPEKMWPLMEPRRFLPHPHLFKRRGVLLREREELQIWWEYLLRTHCCHTGSLAAKAWVWNFDWTAFSSSKCGIFSDLPHVNWEPLFILFLLRCSRETGWSGGAGG